MRPYFSKYNNFVDLLLIYNKRNWNCHDVTGRDKNKLFDAALHKLELNEINILAT